MGIPHPPPPTPSPLHSSSPSRLSPPPRGDGQAHFYGSLIKGGHYLLSVHSELWRRNLLLPVSGPRLRNAVMAQSEPGGWLPAGCSVSHAFPPGSSETRPRPHRLNSGSSVNPVYLSVYLTAMLLSTEEQFERQVTGEAFVRLTSSSPTEYVYSYIVKALFYKSASISR